MTEMRKQQRELSRMLRKKVRGENASKAKREAAHDFLYKQIRGNSWNNDSRVYGVGFRTVQDYTKACSFNKRP